MSINLLAIEVGNTRLHLGLFLDDNLTEEHHLALNADSEIRSTIRNLHNQLQDTEHPAAYLASVNDPAAENISAIVNDIAGQTPERLEAEINIPIGRQLDPEALPGEDRLLNAAAAYNKIKEACIVIAAGTAVTIDFVDGAGTFHGGAILPGAQMQLNALHENTAQLPQINFEPPTEPVGHNTVQAMLTGVYHGIRGAVRELVEQYAQIYNAWPKVIATGGDAQPLFEKYDMVEAIVPELTLLGIRAARHFVLNPPQD